MNEVGWIVVGIVVWLILGVIAICILNPKYDELRKLGWYAPEKALGMMEGALLWCWPGLFLELRECKRIKKKLLSTKMN